MRTRKFVIEINWPLEHKSSLYNNWAVDYDGAFHPSFFRRPSWPASRWRPIGNPAEWPWISTVYDQLGPKQCYVLPGNLSFMLGLARARAWEWYGGLWSTKVQVTWVKILVSLSSKRPQTTLRAFYLIFPFPLKVKAVKYQWILQFSFLP